MENTSAASALNVSPHQTIQSSIQRMRIYPWTTALYTARRQATGMQAFTTDYLARVPVRMERVVGLWKTGYVACPVAQTG